MHRSSQAVCGSSAMVIPKCASFFSCVRVQKSYSSAKPGLSGRVCSAVPVRLVAHPIFIMITSGELSSIKYVPQEGLNVTACSRES